MSFHSLPFDLVLLGVVVFFVALLALLRMMRRGPSGVREDVVTVSIIRSGNLVEQRTTRLTYPNHPGPVFAITWSPDGRYLAAGQQSVVCVWLAKLGQSVFTYTGHSSSVRSLAWSPRGKFQLISGSEDRSVQLWLFKLCGNLQQFKAYTPHEVLSLAWSPEGGAFVCGGDVRIRLYSGMWPEIQSVSFETQLNDPVQAIAWSPTGEYIATAGYDGYIDLWNVASRQRVVVYAALDTEVTALAFTPSGTSLVASYVDGVVRVWQVLETGTLPTQLMDDAPVMRYPALTFREHAKRVAAVAVSPDGVWVASGGVEKTVRVWSLETGDMRFAYQVQSHVLSLVWSPSGKHLAVGSSDTPLHVIRVPS